MFYGINQIFMRVELTDLMMKKFRTAKYKLEDVVSYEEFIRMKVFIQKLKRNKTIANMLRNDPETADFLDSGDEYLHYKAP